MEWLFWQMGGLGPMAGQNNHFSNYAVEKMQYAMDRYRNEVNRLYGVMNKRLADRPFLAGEYSIADMACYPWIVPWERQGQNIADFPHLKRWFEAIKARPAVVKAYEWTPKINPGQGGIRTAGRTRDLVRPDRAVGRRGSGEGSTRSFLAQLSSKRSVVVRCRSGSTISHVERSRVQRRDRSRCIAIRKACEPD